MLNWAAELPVSKVLTFGSILSQRNANISSQKLLQVGMVPKWRLSAFLNVHRF